MLGIPGVTNARCSLAVTALYLSLTTTRILTKIINCESEFSHPWRRWYVTCTVPTMTVYRGFLMFLFNLHKPKIDMNCFFLYVLSATQYKYNTCTYTAREQADIGTIAPNTYLSHYFLWKYQFSYVYVLLLLCMFRSRYSVSLCCSVYCFCVNVYCTIATGCQPNCS